MTPGDEDWVTEICEEGGSAFSMKLGRKLHEEKTSWQTIAIYETIHFGTLMTIDGFVMLTDLDNFIYHEMMSHPALFTHRNPCDVAIIGGGDCGTLREVLKHEGVATVTQIDIDERVTRLSEQYFPALCDSNDDPRANLLFDDGIKWVKNAAPGGIDVIIVDSTDPIGPAEGLFGEPFYRDCRNALGEQGILVQQSESPLYHRRIIEPMHEAMHNAGFEHVRTLHFPQPCYPSGWWSATMATSSPDGLDTFRTEDADNRTFATGYYNADIHSGALASPEFMRRDWKL